MPFYIRPRARYPLWLPPVIGAVIILILTASRGLTGGIGTAILHTLSLALMGGLITGGFYWGYTVPLVRKSLPLRWLISTVAIAAYLATFTLAISRADGTIHWNRVTQSTFLTSTLLLSVLLGWVVGRDLFGLSPLADRVYLTPAEFNALPEGERARLRPDGSGEEKA
jgi:hypothetical protein